MSKIEFAPKLWAAAGATALTAVAAPAHAGVMMLMETPSSTSGNLTVDVGDSSILDSSGEGVSSTMIFSFPKFDTSLGTLTGVELSWNDEGFGGEGAYGFSALCGEGGGDCSYDWSMSFDIDTSLSAPAGFSDSGEGSFSAGGFGNLSTSDNVDVTENIADGVTPNDSSGTTSPNSTWINLDPFEGAGTWDFTAMIEAFDGSYSISCEGEGGPCALDFPGGFSQIASEDVGATADASVDWNLFDPKVTYTYKVAEVPEPATILLMLPGLAGLGFAAYRRRRSPGPVSD